VLFIFDINETLLDMRPLDDVIGSTERRREWFALVIKAALVSASTGVYRDFADLGGAAAAMCGLGEDAVERLGATMRTLPGHPDVLPGLKRLRGGGHRLVALGNSPRRVLEPQLENAGIAPLLHAVYSVEQAHALKPHPAAYHHALTAEGVTAAEATMVAAHDWDIAGAAAVGMRTALLTRGGQRPLPLQPAPTSTVSTIGQLTPQ